MELKIRNQTSKNYKLIRIVSLVVLPILLIIHTFYFHKFSDYLLSKHQLAPFIPIWLWDAGVKFIIYTIQIAINFCILLAFTKQLRYSLLMVYFAYTILITGLIFVVLKEAFHIPVAFTIISFFVKINKGFLLLVLFIAGHLVYKSSN